MNTTQDVQLSSIDIPECFRQHTMESVDALAQDIQRNGQLQEVVVTPKEGGRYELVAGKRRTLAMRHLNKETVRAQVMESLNELQKALIMIAENDEREDVNPFDRALSYQRAVKASTSQKELAAQLGISEDKLSKTLSVLQFAPEITEELRRRDYSGAHLQELVRLPDAQSQLKMADACDKAGWSSKVLRDKVSRALGQTQNKPKDGAGAQQEETIIDCRLSLKGKVILVKPRAFKLGEDNFHDYATDIQAALTQFVSGLGGVGAALKAGEVSQAA